MPDITIYFSSDINNSVQVGDTAYYCPITNVGGFSTSTQESIVEIGPILVINHKSITGSTDNIVCDALGSLTPPQNGAYIFFSKDNAVNVSSPIGYFARARFVNDSKIKSEMFATSCEVFESSK